MEDLNPDSLKIIQDALVEPAVVIEKPDVRFQFERHGYFYADSVDYTDAKPVFNKIVGLKESWGKKNSTEITATKMEKREDKKVQIEGKTEAMSEAEQSLFNIYTNELGLNSMLAEILARDEKLSSFYENTLSLHNSPVTIANIVANEVAREFKEKQASELKFTPSQIAELVKMIDDGTISNKIAKEVFEEMATNGEDPMLIVQAKGLIQISDVSVIEPIIDEIIAKNPDNVAKFKSGNTNLLGFFVGQVLKATGGKANPSVVNELIAQKLSY
ncbi:MAG: glutaminyl-tRNA synthetase, partial [Campylobacterota bacterium]|nr:glutaminyl-tRNA synthetase [Campylobacterota bacterium]